MWKVSWFYEKEHNVLVVPLYYYIYCMRDDLNQHLYQVHARRHKFKVKEVTI